MLIKVFEINANWRENYPPIKEINAKEGVIFQNEGNQRDQHKETPLFLTTEYKDHEQNRTTGVWGNFFTDNVR